MKAANAAPKEDRQLQQLKEVRKTCGLIHVPVAECLRAFKGAAVDGTLTHQRFCETYEVLLRNYAPQDERSEAAMSSTFELFDRDQNGVVDIMELVSGIATFCSGNDRDKIQAVFDVFDENGDGFISMEDMYKLVSAVFKVVLTSQVLEKMRSMGLGIESPDELASVTTQDCFKTADLNQDGKISLEEFRAWFHGSGSGESPFFPPLKQMLA